MPSVATSQKIQPIPFQQQHKEPFQANRPPPQQQTFGQQLMPHQQQHQQAQPPSQQQASFQQHKPTLQVQHPQKDPFHGHLPIQNQPQQSFQQTQKPPQQQQPLKQQQFTDNPAFVKKDSDWVCSKCRNVNYTFRQACNRCKAPKAVASEPTPEIQQSQVSTKTFEIRLFRQNAENTGEYSLQNITLGRMHVYGRMPFNNSVTR